MSLDFDQTFLENIIFIHEVKIFNEIQNKKKIIIFDLRKRDEYNKCFIEESINIPYNEFDDEYFQTFDENKISELTANSALKQKIIRYKRYFLAIIISEKKIRRTNILKLIGSEDEQDRMKKSLTLYKSLIKNKVREIGFYNKGFEKIATDYSFLVNHISCRPTLK